MKMTIVEARNGRKGQKGTVKRIRVFGNMSKTPEHILQRYGEFTLLAAKFEPMRWRGEVTFSLQNALVDSSSAGLFVVEEDKATFLQNAEVLLATL